MKSIDKSKHDTNGSPESACYLYYVSISIYKCAHCSLTIITQITSKNYGKFVNRFVISAIINNLTYQKMKSLSYE
jgi:hypothetical protein